MAKIANVYGLTGSRRGYFILGISVIVLSFLLMYSPIKAYFAQRADLARTSAEIAALRAQQSQLNGKIAQLNNPGELAYLAKVELNMVYPGQRSYLTTK